MKLQVFILLTGYFLLLFWGGLVDRADAASPITKLVLKAIRERTNLNTYDKRGYGLLHHAAAVADRTTRRCSNGNQRNADFSRADRAT